MNTKQRKNNNKPTKGPESPADAPTTASAIATLESNSNASTRPQEAKTGSICLIPVGPLDLVVDKAARSVVGKMLRYGSGKALQRSFSLRVWRYLKGEGYAVSCLDRCVLERDFKGFIFQAHPSGRVFVRPVVLGA